MTEKQKGAKFKFSETRGEKFLRAQPKKLKFTSAQKVKKDRFSLFFISEVQLAAFPPLFFSFFSATDN